MNTRFFLPLLVFLFLASSLMTIAQLSRPVLLPVPSDPTISFKIWFAVGSQNDPAGKEGLALLTASMLTEAGTERHGYEDILGLLYPMAAGYGSTVDKEMTVISGRVHKDNLDAYYPLLLDAILRPGFREEDFTRIKSDMINAIEKSLRYANDEELGKAAFYQFMFEGTPYSHLETGTVQSLNSITLEDVRAFWKAQYTKDKVTIALGGGYAPALVARLKKDLGVLPAGSAVSPPPPAVRPIQGLELLAVEKDCDATAISFGFPISVLRGQDDFYALALFNSWFGEHRNSSSHLYQVIREARGMNYGDYSYIEVFPNGGRLQMPPPHHARRQQVFEVWIRPVQNVQRHFALRAALRELEMVVDKGMTPEAFALTKKFLLKYCLHFAGTTSERLGYAVDSRFYGISGDYLKTFRKKIAALTLEQVNAALRRHLSAKNLRIAVVTRDAAGFVESLVTNAPSPITYDTPKPQQVLDEDAIIAKHPLSLSRDKVRIVKVDDMFE